MAGYDDVNLFCLHSAGFEASLAVRLGVDRLPFRDVRLHALRILLEVSLDAQVENDLGRFAILSGGMLDQEAHRRDKFGDARIYTSYEEVFWQGHKAAIEG